MFSAETRTMSGTSEGRVLSPRDASILSLIARLSQNKARQRETFSRLEKVLDDDFSREIAGVLVGTIDKASASRDAAVAAAAMEEWVDVKIRRTPARRTRSARLRLASRFQTRKRI